MTDTSRPAALEVERMSVRFGGLVAVHDVSMSVPVGARYGVLGPNGAGKTTLFNAITGLVDPAEGRVLLNGEDISRLPTHQRMQQGLTRTFQITTLFSEMSVLENVLMASLVQAGTHQVFWRPAIYDQAAVDIARTQLERLGLDQLSASSVSQLSYGQQRMLEIALALASDPSVLLLDEPTAGLSAAEIKAVIDLINQLPPNLTVVMIEHDLDVIFDVTDYLTVLHFGEAIAHGPSETIRQDERVKEVYLGESEEKVLSVEDIHVYYGQSHVLQGTTLAVPKGAITALVGRNGVGKTTLINAIMGLLPVRSGSIMLYHGGSQADLTQKDAADRKGLGIAIVPQGRRLFRSLTVDEHLNLVQPIKPEPYDLDAIYAIFPRLKERRRAGASTLSGGEQSMLAIARALILNPDVLLTDEPTEGLAPLLVEMIGEVISQLREGGLTVLIVEQKLKFALNVADKIAVMERGRIIGAYARSEIEDVSLLSDMILSGSTTA